MWQSNFQLEIMFPTTMRVSQFGSRVWKHTVLIRYFGRTANQASKPARAQCARCLRFASKSRNVVARGYGDWHASSRTSFSRAVRSSRARVEAPLDSSKPFGSLVAWLVGNRAAVKRCELFRQKLPKSVNARQRSSAFQSLQFRTFPQ
jgi:hypothetical protein